MIALWLHISSLIILISSNYIISQVAVSRRAARMPCVRYDCFSDPWLQLGGEPMFSFFFDCVPLNSKTQRPPKIPIIHDSVEEILHFWAPNIRHGDTVSLEDLRDALLDRERGCRGAVWQGLQRSNLASCSEIVTELGELQDLVTQLWHVDVIWCHDVMPGSWKLKLTLKRFLFRQTDLSDGGFGIRSKRWSRHYVGFRASRARVEVRWWSGKRISLRFWYRFAGVTKSHVHIRISDYIIYLIPVSPSKKYQHDLFWIARLELSVPWAGATAQTTLPMDSA